MTCSPSILPMLLVAFAASAVPTLDAGQRDQATAVSVKSTDEPVPEGIPIDSELTKAKCGSCHKTNPGGHLSRISYIRTSPEGWEAIIKRMIELNGLRIEPAEAREVLKYLANNLGLAPSEAKDAAFEAEQRRIDYTYSDSDTQATCTKCHSIGRVISQRRTKEEWQLLIAMHRARYPYSDFQAFRQNPAQRRNQQTGELRKQPMDRVVDHLSAALPLTTPSWSAWSATMRPPQIAGRWAIRGYQPGLGPIVGQLTVTDTPDHDSFVTDASYVYARTGQSITRHGRAIVYTGFQWRGTSTGDFLGPPGVNHNLREVMFINEGWRAAEGRWFTGAYQEFGIDVRLDRVGTEPTILGLDKAMIRTGSTVDVRLWGLNLPSSISPTDISFGDGVHVNSVMKTSATQMVVNLSVSDAAREGRRAVLLSNGGGDVAATVYRQVNYIKVRPAAGLARVGGAVSPKQYEQFEAVAYSSGPDGTPDTKDDLELGPIDVKWSLEEYSAATYSDDDLSFVGSIDASTGLFTPNLDGPNPKRRNETNNMGDVWVVATYANDVGGGNDIGRRTLKARAHLLVTAPLFMRFGQYEVGR